MLNICPDTVLFYNCIMVSCMKKFFLKLILILSFILNLSIQPVFANFLDISSVTFDNSGAIISLNSTDNLNYPLESKPVIVADEESKTVYFDLQPARIKSDKSYIIDSNEIFEVSFKQISSTPDIVRVILKYKESYNPQNISLKRLHNTIFIKLKNPVISNYYFQETYKESVINEIFEKIYIQEKIRSQNNIVSEINSAFSSMQQANDDNYILAAKNLLLKTKLYISSLTIKGETPILNVIGSYTLVKPIYLTNPNRAVFDIKNAIVNPLLRNQDVPCGYDSIKIGQFDRNTARVVITAEKPDMYVPVIYGDTGKIAFINTVNSSPLNLYNSLSNMTAVSSEKTNDSNNYSVKFSFSNPVVLGLNRKSNNIDLLIYNLNNYFSGAIKSELRNTPFENMKISDIKNGGARLQLPLANQNDKVDIYLGADGKTLRVKLKTSQKYVPKEEPADEIIFVPPVVMPHNNGKKYIVIDAGHGGSDYGAIRNNINEKDITLDIAKRVQAQLEKKGYVVAMTREDDTYVSLQDRVVFSETFNPDIFVSIHVNSSNSETPFGLETHYYKDDSLKLAKYLHASMLNNISSKDRGLFKSKFYVINHTTAPAILLETGFISNPSERAQIITEGRKNATAKAIVEGIDDYFKHE